MLLDPFHTPEGTPIALPLATPPPPNALGAIKQAAASRGLAWQPLAAVAHYESGLNPRAVGDGGHAFGLFQNNNAGGTITGDPNPQRFFNPLTSANYAADAVKRLGIQGLSPAQQVAAIVNRYERPQKPLPEIAGAQSYLATLGQQGAATSPVATPALSAPLSKVASSLAPLPQMSLAPLQSSFDLGQQSNQRALDALGKLSGRDVEAPQAPNLASLMQPQTPALAPTLAAPTAVHATTKRGATIGGIVNQQNLGRTDQGVDFRGHGAIPAFASGVVTRVDTKGTGWPGATGANSGAMITYKITSGPNAGRFVYIAESLVPHVKVGQTIAAGQTIATALGTGAMTEMGWAADAHGTTLAHATTGYTEGQGTNAGKSFRTYLGL